MAATLRSYFARCLYDSHQPAHTAKSCLKELRSYDPRLFLAKSPFASHSVGKGHDSLILLLRPCCSPSNARHHLAARDIAIHRAHVVAAQVNGDVRQTELPQRSPSHHLNYRGPVQWLRLQLASHQYYAPRFFFQLFRGGQLASSPAFALESLGGRLP